MDNIYELVDDACVKVKNDTAYRKAADLIIRGLNFLDIDNLPHTHNSCYAVHAGYHHCAAYFHLLGQRRSIEMRVYEKYEREVSTNYEDPRTARSAQINAGKIIANLKEFINKNYLRLNDIRPSEILEAIPPIIYKEILYGDHQRGSSPPTYHNCRIGVVRWELV